MTKILSSVNLLFVVLLFLVSCKNDTIPERIYVRKGFQSPSFETQEVDRLMNSQQNMIHETQLDSMIHGKKSFEEIIHFKNQTEEVHCFRYEFENADILTYQTKDSIKLLVYFAINIDSDFIYMLKDTNYKKQLKALIHHPNFIFNKLNQPPPNHLLLEE